MWGTNPDDVIDVGLTRGDVRGDAVTIIFGARGDGLAQKSIARIVRCAHLFLCSPFPCALDSFGLFGNAVLPPQALPQPPPLKRARKTSPGMNSYYPVTSTLAIRLPAQPPLAVCPVPTVHLNLGEVSSRSRSQPLTLHQLTTFRPLCFVSVPTSSGSLSVAMPPVSTRVGKPHVRFL